MPGRPVLDSVQSSPKGDCLAPIGRAACRGRVLIPRPIVGKKEWLASLSPTAQLFLSNGVVIAITLGIILNATLRAALRTPLDRP